MRPARVTFPSVRRRSNDPGGRRFGVRRVLLASAALAWIAAGLIGTYSYLENYNLHRGFGTPARLARATAGRLLTVHFYSRALGRRTDYLIYMPAAYDPARRYPAFYLLHGMPGRPLAFTVIGNIEVRLDNLISEGRVPPMILVFPDGRINGGAFTDSEWANTPWGQFDSYVIDVVRDVDRRFAALPERQARVIAGLSAGAYGAINIALHHLSRFGSVQVWSGYFTQTRSGVFAHATNAQLAYNSPIEYVRGVGAALAADPLRAYLLVGRGDSASRQIVPMARALKAQGATVSYAIYAGGHDWQLWNAHLDQMLILAGRDVRDPLPRSASPARRRTPRAPPRAHRTSRSQAPAHPRPVAHQRRRARSVAAGARHSRPAAGALGAGGLVAGLLLALASAAAINLGFLLQHRGLHRMRSPEGGQWELLRAAVRSPSWLGGQALGWAGFAAQVVAVSLAPLSLVQAFAAGGLALSVPLAAGLFGYRISRVQLLAVLVVAFGLATLPIDLSAKGDRLHTGLLLAPAALALAAAVPTGLARSASLRAIAAGLFYGVADAGIKAVTVSWAAHGSAVQVSGWAALALLGTFGGFLTFQAALRAGSAITAISLMNALAALLALSCGVLAFGESIGSSPGALIAHLVAIALVLGCVPVLAAAQTEIADPSEHDVEKVGHPRLPSRIAVAADYRAGKRAAGGEQQSFHPRTGPRTAGP